MILIDLSGIWELKDKRGEYRLKGALPGCNYLGFNGSSTCLRMCFTAKTKARALGGGKGWEYSREFTRPRTFGQRLCFFADIANRHDCRHIHKFFFCGFHKNAHIDYKFDIKGLLTEGGNEIRIYFHSPLKYVEEKRREDALTKNRMGISGYPHIRKAAYHFGWDWGAGAAAVGRKQRNNHRRA